MGEEIAVRVLGPVQVRAAGAWKAAGTPQHRLLLAMLALAGGQVVPSAELIDVLWGEHPPRSAHVSLQALVSRLRQALAGISGSRLECCGDGYRLRLPPGLVDVHRFRALTAAARRAADPDAAIAALDEALGLWRGPALADVRGTDRAELIRAGLATEHLSAAADRIDWLVASGRERAAAAELPALIASHPLAERLAGMFMVALYRCGQRGEAVQVFLDTRARLAAELGVEPGPELQRLYQRILAGDPELAATAAASCSAAQRAGTPAAGAGPRMVPRQLPPVTPGFAGRAAELAALDELLSNGSGDSGPAVCVISGTAGVGKTTLALHWAHHAASGFPGGQLYVNLRGFGPSATPVRAGQAIRGFLHALGVSAAQLPRSLDAQAALHRSITAGKRLLVVLDNARDADQVRPLLAGGKGCVVLVTSRSQLTGLVVAEGARTLSLDVMPDADACEVLARRLGARAVAEPQAAAELAGLCARLPLALAIAAGRAQERPGLPLAALATELRDSQQRLDCLDTGDAASSVREVFSWSQQQLSGPARRMFRLLGTHPGPDISAMAAASLAGVPVRHARHLLAELTRAHLLAEHRPGRFTCHDLLRAYAAELAQTNSDAARRAHCRILDYYLHSASAATWLLYPTRDPLVLADPQRGVTSENLRGPAQALAWFHAEQQALLAAIPHAAAAGLDGHAWQLAAAMTDYLNRQGYWDDLEAIQATALAAAGRAGDPAGQAHAHLGLGAAWMHTAGPDRARGQLEQAIRLFGQLGDQARQARSYVTLGNVYADQARYREARRHTEHALRLYLQLGRRGGQALALTNLGWLHAKLGDYQAALTCCRRALHLHRKLGNLSGQAHTWGHLGYARHCLADNAAAITCYQRALRLLRDLSDRPEQASVLTRLADTYHRSGDLAAARNASEQALGVLKDLQGLTARHARTHAASHVPV